MLFHNHRARSSSVRGRADDDFDLLPERAQESEESVECEAFHATPDEGGHLWLIDPEHRGGSGLGELSFGDDGADALDEFRLRAGQVWVGQAEVGE
jgi:hypothetical protein